MTRCISFSYSDATLMQKRWKPFSFIETVIHRERDSLLQQNTKKEEAIAIIIFSTILLKLLLTLLSFLLPYACGLDKKRPRLLWNVITQKKTISFGIDSEMKRNGRGWSWMVECFKWLSSHKNQRIRKIWSTKHLLKSVELNLNRRFDRHLACQVVVLMLEAQKNCNYKLSWGEKTYTIPMNLISTKWK